MTLTELLSVNGPATLVLQAEFEPVGGLDRFQPTGFPEIGPVIYKAPRRGDVCIVDSPPSMANHLETVCMAGQFDTSLHPDLTGLPYMICVTDRNRNKPAQDDLLDRIVCTTLTEGHRLASDYFLDGFFEPKWAAESTPQKGKKGKAVSGEGWTGRLFREQLRQDFGIEEVTKDKKYWVDPGNWWQIFKQIFKYDPNSLVHGVMFAKEQIKVVRVLAANLEATGAKAVRRSGVKFDRLGKTTSGQPIFSVEEETADRITGTFVIDLALIRSYGRGEHGLNEAEKRLLLELSLWKIQRLTEQPFRFRSGCYLQRLQNSGVNLELLDQLKIKGAIEACQFNDAVTKVYYPSTKLFKAGEDTDKPNSPVADTVASEGTTDSDQAED